MAHPFASEVKKGSQAKYKAMTGKKSSSQRHPDESADKALFKKMIKQDRGEYKVGGAVSSGADKFARGGRTKGKKGNNVNITIVNAGKDKEAAPPMMPPMPPMPPGPMAPPPGMDGGPPPGGMPVGMPTGGLPGMNRGGKVKMRGGAESGVGRLDKIKAYGLKKRG